MQEDITFLDLNLSDTTIEALNKKGFEAPSPIQALVIPHLLEQTANIIGQAQTGTGKTAAFSIPIIETLNPERGKVKALVLTPTRELANQVSDEIYSIIGKRKLKVLPVYGGQSIDLQIKNIHRGVDIIVGTPGRIIDLLDRGVLDLSFLQFFVLDEADEMLNMGFIDDVEDILKVTNPDKKMLFFSATMPDSILRIAKNYMKEYKILKVENKTLTTQLTEQIYFEIHESDKFETLCRILDCEQDFYGIIFARTKNETDEVTEHLKARGYEADAIHGDVTQALRNRTLASFKKRKINILVATDVAARGIDVTNLTHVINYSVPNEAESYVHRIGRTGRAGKKGVAITFITPKEFYQLARIMKATNSHIQKGSTPTVEQVIKAKIDALDTSLRAIIEQSKHKDYLEFAQEMLNSNHPEVAIAALLRHVYGDRFLAHSYAEIREPIRNDNRRDRDRDNRRPKNSKSWSQELTNLNSHDEVKLFMALGKKDGISGPRSLVEIIFSKARTPSRKVKNVRILESFSFVTVPFDEVESIMKAFNGEDSRQRPVVTIAKK